MAREENLCLLESLKYRIFFHKQPLSFLMNNFTFFILEAFYSFCYSMRFSSFIRGCRSLILTVIWWMAVSWTIMRHLLFLYYPWPERWPHPRVPLVNFSTFLRHSNVKAFLVSTICTHWPSSRPNGTVFVFGTLVFFFLFDYFHYAPSEETL